MPLQPPALSPQELATRGTLLSQRYRLQARFSRSLAPGSWLAFDEVLARTVVVQYLPSGASLAAAELAAVRAASRLTDPRIARIFDADDTAGCSYVICEHAPGQPLDQMLGAGPLDPKLAATITAEAAWALAGAHAAGAPHLCLTLRSLQWGESGLKITGLAVESAAAGVTHAYPGVADSLALGRVLYALLTGYWPGARATALPPAPRRDGRLYQPRQVRAGIPAALNYITSRALGLDATCPEFCFAGPASLAAALRAVIAVPARPYGRMYGPRRAAAWAATARQSALSRHAVIAATERAGDETIVPPLLSDCA